MAEAARTSRSCRTDVCTCGRPTDIAYFLSNAPLKMALKRLTQVAAARATIEQCLETAKDETGLDQYEVRYWHSWHRHIPLARMAQAWLAAIRARTTAIKRETNLSWLP